jgi:hypothetical protein
MMKSAVMVKRMIRSAGLACTLTMMILAAGTAQGQGYYRVTPPPSGSGYGTGTGSYNPYGTGSSNQYGSGYGGTGSQGYGTGSNMYGSNYGSNMYGGSGMYGNSGYGSSGYGSSGYGTSSYGTLGRGTSGYGSTGYGTAAGRGGSRSNTRYRNQNTGAYDQTQQGSQYGTRGRNSRGATGTPGPNDRTGRGRNGRQTPRGATPTPSGALRPGQTPGAASTRTGQPGQTIQGAERQTAAGGARQGGGVTASFQFKPAPDVAVLYMTPLQTNVPVGEEFETMVSLANPGAKKFDTIEVALRFDPLVVEPVRLDQEAVEPLLEGRSESAVFTEAGILTYRAQLAQPADSQAIDLFNVRWKTLGVSPHADISFTQARGYRTALISSEDKPDVIGPGAEELANILGGPGNRGMLGMSAQIYSPQELRDGPPIGDRLFADRDNRTSRGSVRLSLVTNRPTIPANDDFYVGVWFENPRLVDVSKLRFVVRFDPSALEVIDDDANNWIGDGVNIFDGDYHQDFPFDMHLANHVSNETGVITYAVATTQQRVLPERGFVARIRFRPKAIVRSTPVTFEFARDEDAQRTEVTWMGADVLGEPGVPGDGVKNLAVRITPPEYPKILAAERLNGTARR